MNQQLSAKAFVYLRVSGKGQIGNDTGDKDDRDGFKRQREACASYAARNGCEVEREFLDKGISGKSETIDRPGLTELLLAIAGNGVRLVIVENSTRLARDLMISELILEQFRKLDVKVVEADSGQDLTVADQEPTRILLRQILGAVAQWDKSMLVRKLAAARARIRKGTKTVPGRKCEGQKQFGELPGELPILLEIQMMKSSGRSPDFIASVLNERKCATRGKTGIWYPATVAKILKRQLTQSPKSD